MSWILTAARSCSEAVIMILNFRGRNENPMQRRVLSQYFRPDAGILDLAGRYARPLVRGDVGMLLPGSPWYGCRRREMFQCIRQSASLIQLNWMFCRVVKWP
jgi:hypothetical protein